MQRRPFRRTTATLSAFALVLPGAALLAIPASAATTTWTVAGPSGSGGTAAQVTLTDGNLTFGVNNGNQAVLSPSPIGLATSAADLTRGLTFASRSDRTVIEAYTMLTGKQRNRSTTYNEATFSFTGAGGARLNLVVRASNAGAAYRYVVPGSGTVNILRDASSFTVPASSRSWVVTSHSEDQGRWQNTTAGGAPADDFRVPALFQVGDRYALVAETDLDGRYAAQYLHHNAGSGTYSTTLASPVSARLPLNTPWRTFAVGDLATVTTSNLVDDLAPASRVTDTSWVRPGTVSWSWLTENASPRDANRQREYIDFAAKNGWNSVLIDEGWNSSWVPDVVSYARSKGVNIILWFHSNQLWTATQRRNWLPQIRSWGVTGIKVDFSYQFTQPTLQWYDAILADTSAEKLMINFHGSGTARGMQRTWPHVMTTEAVFGAEMNQNRAALNTILPFTRNVISSMDFTPVEFSLANRDTTDGHELATGIVYESGWQHLGDRPESYEANFEALRILNQLPTAWDETRLIGGRPSEEAVFARRSGSKWYIGGLSALPARTFNAPLNFLGGGQYLLETVRDGNAGLQRETRVVTNTSSLSVPMLQRGGFAAVACPYTTGMTSCASGGEIGILKGKASGKCLDVIGASQANGTAVALWECNGGTNQSWTLSSTGQIKGLGGKCLDVNGGATADGSRVQLWDCNNSGAQQWEVRGDGAVVNPPSGKCLDVNAHGTANGSAVTLWSCNAGATNQQWLRSPIQAVLKLAGTNLCIDVPNTNRGNGTRPALFGCHGARNQLFTSTATNQLTYYSLICLQPAGTGTGDGTAVEISACTNSNARQQWNVRADGSTVNVATGKCLATANNATSSGTEFVISTCNGATGQRFARN